MRCQRRIRSRTDSPSRWPIVSEPVTLGGGIEMTNGRPAAGQGWKAPRGDGRDPVATAFGRAIAGALPCAAWLLLARGAAAMPGEFLPVGDPLESELRVLAALGPAPLGGRLRLAHLATRPVQFVEIE